MDIVKDVLDKAVVDRNGRAMGRVDGIMLEPRDGMPPRVAGILIGPAALGYRLRPGLGRWWKSFEQRLGLPPDRPDRIDVSEIDEVGSRIKLRLTIGETAVEAIEQRLRAWIVKIPGQPVNTVLRLDRLIGREVYTANNRRLGRLEEVRAEPRGDDWVITEYLIGAAGMKERLGLGVRLVIGITRVGGYSVRWDQLDLSNPDRPTLLCPVEALRRLA